MFCKRTRTTELFCTWILPQALEIVAIAKITIRPGSCVVNHDAVGVAEVGYGPQRNSYSVTL
jgi:hypothetical protein